MALHLDQRCFLDQGSLVDAVFKAVADLGSGDLGSKLGDELFVHRLLHVQAIRADAGLAGVAVLAGKRAFDSGVDVGVFKDDEGRIAAEFQ